MFQLYENYSINAAGIRCPPEIIPPPPDYPPPSDPSIDSYL